jgi:hypothetical protein
MTGRNMDDDEEEGEDGRGSEQTKGGGGGGFAVNPIQITRSDCVACVLLAADCTN